VAFLAVFFAAFFLAAIVIDPPSLCFLVAGAGPFGPSAPRPLEKNRKVVGEAKRRPPGHSPGAYFFFFVAFLAVFFAAFFFAAIVGFPPFRPELDTVSPSSTSRVMSGLTY